MSIDKPTYKTTGNSINQAALLSYADPGYQAPTFEDVAAAKQSSGLSAAEIGRLVGVEARTVRKWLAPPTVQNSARMPYAAWRLLVIHCGLAKPGMGYPLPADEGAAIKSCNQRLPPVAKKRAADPASGES